jgi:hypothetical protein
MLKRVVAEVKLMQIDPEPPSRCQSAFDWDPLSASKRGSDATLVQRWSYNADQAGLKQVQLGTSVRLTLDQLELGDLALGLVRWTKTS